jgi:hypothetical protein
MTVENIVIIGDFLKDLDDEHALVGASELHRQKKINLLGVIGNLAPASLRARGAKGTLSQLGLSNIPVGIGTPVFETKSYPYESNIPYLADISEVEPDGQAMLSRILSSHKNITLALISGLTDAANLLRNQRDLFTHNIKQVVIMGGVETQEDTVKLTNGFLTPNNANNNSFDMNSATYLYQTLQTLEVPTITVTREVAYVAQVPFSIYDQMEATRNPIGICLKSRQKPALQHLWEAAISPRGSSLRGTLPDDRDRDWFIRVFCGGNIPNELINNDIWPYVSSFNLYDPTALYAAVPEIANRFYKPTEVTIGNIRHKIIGVSSSNHGVNDPKALVEFMMETEINALKLGTK